MTVPAILGGTPRFTEPLPFHRPATPPLAEVFRRLQPSYERGTLTDGPLVRELEDAARERLEVPHVVAVSSCTSGLMLCIQALNPRRKPVVLPSLTFSASAHAAAWAGAPTVFAECESAGAQLDVADAQRRLTGVGLLMATHVYGTPCAAEEVARAGRQAGVAVLFDAAHAFGALRQGSPVGGFGDAEVFSLSPTKVLVAGEGGLIACRDEELAARLRIGRNYGNPGDYDTLFAGLNARMSELHAAVALSSLEQLDDHLARRVELVARYMQGLSSVPGIRAQHVDAGDRSTYKDFVVFVDPEGFGLGRDALAAALRAEGIDTRPYFWPPVHQQQSYTGSSQHLPVTERVARSALALPLWRDLPVEAVEAVAETIDLIHQHADRCAGHSLVS